jgi:hypothetical protein
LHPLESAAFPRRTPIPDIKASTLNMSPVFDYLISPPLGQGWHLRGNQTEMVVKNLISVTASTMRSVLTSAGLCSRCCSTAEG